MRPNHISELKGKPHACECTHYLYCKKYRVLGIEGAHWRMETLKNNPSSIIVCVTKDIKYYNPYLYQY